MNALNWASPTGRKSRASRGVNSSVARESARPKQGHEDRPRVSTEVMKIDLASVAGESALLFLVLSLGFLLGLLVRGKSSFLFVQLTSPPRARMVPLLEIFMILWLVIWRLSRLPWVMLPQGSGTL